MVVSIRSRDFQDFQRRAKAVDKRIIPKLRKEMKSLGAGSLDASKATVLLPPPGDSPEWSVGARQAIADGMRVQLSFGKATAGVRLIASPNRLDPRQRSFLAAYNLPQFRHPVFGNRNVYVTQQGRPYFGSVISKHLKKSDVKQMLRVIDEAFKAVGART
jgi:hypothetical protein